MASKFTLNDDVSETIRDIQDIYDSGKIRGMAVVILTEDETINTIFSNLSIVERFGMCRWLEYEAKSLIDEANDG
jgi:hypothetical protein